MVTSERGVVLAGVATGSWDHQIAVDLTAVWLSMKRELAWRYQWDDAMAPWHITDPGGQLDVTLTPDTTSTPRPVTTPATAARPTRSSGPSPAPSAPTTVMPTRSTPSKVSLRKRDNGGDRLP